jgi:hypothetical protein
MNTLFAGRKIIAALFLTAVYACLWAEEPESSGGGKKLFTFSLFESGSWAEGGNLTNRLDLRLYAPLGLTFRAQASDKRLAPPWEHPDSGVTAFGTAIYHKGTGSRLLYGLVETAGLPNRTRKVWSRSAPWFEAHGLSTADLKTAAGDAAESAAYMEISSPSSRLLNGGFSVKLDGNADAVFTGRGGARLPYNSSVRLEGLVTERMLEERKMSQWFSTKPYLPERRFGFYAINAVFTNPYVSFAGDFARSEVFAWGTDIYASAALRVDPRPWRVSIAADGAGERFSGSDGAATGAGFRTAAKFEWEGSRNMLFRANSVLRAAAWQEPFDRGAVGLYFRPPQNKRNFVRLSRISLELERDAQNPARITDGIGIGAAFVAGPFRPSFGITAKQHTAAKPGDYINPFPAYTPKHRFDTVKFSGAVSCKISFADLNGSATYTVTDGKEPSFTSSAGVSVSGKLGRIGLKLSNNVKTGDWSYTLSWRLQKTFG